MIQKFQHFPQSQNCHTSLNENRDKVYFSYFFCVVLFFFYLFLNALVIVVLAMFQQKISVAVSPC